MSYNSMIAPTKYFQGKGLLNEIYDRTCHLGKKYAFLVDDIVYNIIEANIKKAFEGKSENRGEKKHKKRKYLPGCIIGKEHIGK